MTCERAIGGEQALLDPVHSDTDTDRKIGVVDEAAGLEA